MDDKPTVIQALAAVMAEVQAVGKTGRNTEQNYNFRGVDAVVNAVGPVLRKHGVIVLPELEDATLRDVRTSRDKPARESTVRVRYRFYGPAGDSVEAVVPGESMDTGDKGMAKAMSVAYRILWLQALCIPTDEPDPDTQSYERAYEPPVRQPSDAQRTKQQELFAMLGTASTASALLIGWDMIVAAYKADEITTVQANELRAEVGRLKDLLSAEPEPGEPVDARPAGADAAEPTRRAPRPVWDDQVGGYVDPTTRQRDLTDTTRKRIFALFRAVGMDNDTDQHVFLAETIGPDVRSFKKLTEAQGRALVTALDERKRTAKTGVS